MTDRDLILSSLPEDRGRREPEPVDFGYAFASDDLWKSFEQNLSTLGGRMATHKEVRELLDRKSAWCDEGLEGWVNHPAADAWSAEVGLSWGDMAVAHTASIVVRAGDGRKRLSSLTPPHNIIFLKPSQIVPTLETVMTGLPERTCVLVTGTSRTADIEGILVRGVHGPGAVWVCLWEGD